MTSLLASSLVLAACTDDQGGDDDGETSETGDGDGDPTGDGDGDPTGDGDGDPTGDGDGDPTGDGDGDPTGDGDGDPTGDGDGDPTGDGDGDPTGDGDGDPGMCANGEAPGVCELDPMGDAFWLDDFSLDGDCLTLEVSSSGGCAEHVYTSCWDQTFLESEPVQATVWVDHDAMGDLCEAIVSETVVIDLTPLREAYVDAYQTPNGTIDLSVAGELVVYEF